MMCKKSIYSLACCETSIFSIASCAISIYSIACCAKSIYSVHAVRNLYIPLHDVQKIYIFTCMLCNIYIFHCKLCNIYIFPRVGHRVLFRSVHYVLFRSLKRTFRSFTFFFRVLATYETQKNGKKRNVLLQRTEKNAKSGTFFCKERKRTRRLERSFEKNGCPTLIFPCMLCKIYTLP